MDLSYNKILLFLCTAANSFTTFYKSRTLEIRFSIERTASEFNLISLIMFLKYDFRILRQEKVLSHPAVDGGMHIAIMHSL